MTGRMATIMTSEIRLEGGLRSEDVSAFGLSEQTLRIQIRIGRDSRKT